MEQLARARRGQRAGARPRPRAELLPGGILVLGERGSGMEAAGAQGCRLSSPSRWGGWGEGVHVSGSLWG